MKLIWEQAWSRSANEVAPRIYGAHHGTIFLGSEVSVPGHSSQNSSVCYAFNMETGEPEASRKFEPGWTVLGILASPDGSILLLDHCVKHEHQSFLVRAKGASLDEVARFPLVAPAASRGTVLASSADATRVMVAGEAQVSVYDATQGSLQWQARTGEARSPVSAVAVSADGSFGAAAYEEKLILWNLSEATSLFEIKTPNCLGTPSWLGFCNEGTLVFGIGAGRNRRFDVISVDLGKRKKTQTIKLEGFADEKGAAHDLSCDLASDRAAGHGMGPSGDKRAILAWHLKDGDLLERLDGLDYAIDAVRLIGNRLFVVGRDYMKAFTLAA